MSSARPKIDIFMKLPQFTFAGKAKSASSEAADASSSKAKMMSGSTKASTVLPSKLKKPLLLTKFRSARKLLATKISPEKRLGAAIVADNSQVDEAAAAAASESRAPVAIAKTAMPPIKK